MVSVDNDTQPSPTLAASSRGEVAHLTAHPRRVMPDSLDAASIMRRGLWLEGDSTQKVMSR